MKTDEIMHNVRVNQTQPIMQEMHQALTRFFLFQINQSPLLSPEFVAATDDFYVKLNEEIERVAVTLQGPPKAESSVESASEIPAFAKDQPVASGEPIEDHQNERDASEIKE